ncbi:hypothetical protein LCGC14_2464900 [marine sediment metagenome]|uniref:Calcineurin-like phosphoesterase domain-containing protein n=1 Tax=marine sediment metagenome TaxID=412755 RepID=A0A0F9BCP4_9ZZZZ
MMGKVSKSWSIETKGTLEDVQSLLQLARHAGAPPDAFVTVRGNYDAKVLVFQQKRKKWRRTKGAKKYLAFSWADEHISADSRDFLQSLPQQTSFQCGRWRVVLTHGSPVANDEPLGPDTPTARLEELARAAEADLIGCAHSHRPFMRQIDETLFVNPGAVGRPEGGDPRACYALLETADRQPTADLHRVEYDIDRTVEAVRAAGLPEEFGLMFRYGANLKQIQHELKCSGNGRWRESPSAGP